MKKNVGLWIDHRNALIVIPNGEPDEIQRIPSNVEKRGWFSGPAGQDRTADDIRDRGIASDLGKYYDQVIRAIRGFDSIFISGPGEAKKELQKKLESEGLGARIVGVEVADKMTDKQFAAKIRQRFVKAAA
jgi:hypothetical protein